MSTFWINFILQIVSAAIAALSNHPAVTPPSKANMEAAAKNLLAAQKP